MIPRLFWKIFFRGSKYFALFAKKMPPPELNFAEKISDRDFSKLRQNFSKRLNLSNVIWLKLIWFKYELLTPTESKIRASRVLHLLFVQGVANVISCRGLEPFISVVACNLTALDRIIRCTATTPQFY